MKATRPDHPPGSRPNILCIISDDTDFGMLGFGGGRVLTPNLDRLAAAGTVCSRFHTVSPVCTPSRYAYLTGHYPGRCPAPEFRDALIPGEPARISFNTPLIPGRERSFAQVLRDNGYVTGYVGKWHVGEVSDRDTLSDLSPESDPADPEVEAKLRAAQSKHCDEVRRCGFDYASHIHWGNVETRPIPALRVHNLDWLAKGALNFLRESHAKKDGPFFLCVAPTTFHGPHHVASLEADPRLTETGFDNGHLGCLPPRHTIRERLAAAGLPVNHKTAGGLWMDDLVGALLAQLEATGELERTLVFYCTDHGAFDGKRTCYQGGVHIPFVATCPGRVPAGRTFGGLVSNVDFAPTLFDICGIRPPPGMVLDGRSFWPELREGRNDGGHRRLYLEYGYTRALRTKRWKYLAWRPPQRLLEEMKSGVAALAYDMEGYATGYCTLQMRRYPGYWAPDQLYDLEQDPGESSNLARDLRYQDVLRELREMLAQTLATMDDDFPLDTVDPFLTSPAYASLTRRTAMARDPNDWDWYREGAY